MVSQGMCALVLFLSPHERRAASARMRARVPPVVCIGTAVKVSEWTSPG